MVQPIYQQSETVTLPDGLSSFDTPPVRRIDAAKASVQKAAKSIGAIAAKILDGIKKFFLDMPKQLKETNNKFGKISKEMKNAIIIKLASTWYR